jgi:hypothetical protein
MIRALILAAALAVAGCANDGVMGQGGAGDPVAGRDKAGATAVRPAIGSEIVVSFDPGRQAPRYLLERVASRCWLDGIVRGANMIVNRDTGNLTIVDDKIDLLAADFLEPRDGKARLRLSGPVIDDPEKKTRLVTSLERAARGGETGCPIAAG